MVLLAWFVAAAALGVAVGAVLWAQRASNSAPFRAHLALRDRQLDETQHELDIARAERAALADRLAERESAIADLTGRLAVESRRADRVRGQAIEALNNLVPGEGGEPHIDLREEAADDRREL